MSHAVTTAEVLGGESVIGRALEEGIGWVKVVRAGLPTKAVEFLLASDRLSKAELDRVVLPRKTLANRMRIGTLTPEQSDRLLRVARIVARAETTFGDRAKASVWLRRATTVLDGEAPLDLLDTDEGAREVEALLGRIDHGLAA